MEKRLDAMMLTGYAPLVRPQEPDPDAAIPERTRRELISRAAAGEWTAFARLYGHYADRVYAYMLFNVEDAQKAEGLSASVFLQAWRNIGCYSPKRMPFGVWLYRIARDVVLEQSRMQKDASLVKEIVTPEGEGLEAYAGFEPCEK